MATVFDPAAWVAEADTLGYRPILSLSFIKGVKGRGLYMDEPTGSDLGKRGVHEEAHHYAINPRNPDGDANFKALVAHLVDVGRVAS